jgi:CRISPR/Cas system-associated exonuclease Cas4 (RecB family)
MISMRRFGLSKSKITAFEQCPKKLWLATHRPELAQLDDGAEARFATGHEVGDEACRQCAGGVMVQAEPNLAAALETTRALIESGHDAPIFEATFEHEGVLVRCDVLEPDGVGGWRMAEVKSSGGPKPYHKGDLATQIWVVENAGAKVSSAAIRHIDTSFVLEQEGDYRGVFADAELLADLTPLIAGRGAVIEAARVMLAGAEPEVDVGDHCKAPFACEFTDYCNAGLPVGPEWPVTVLPYGGGKKWLAQGVTDLLALDRAAVTNALHGKVLDATVSGIPFHDLDGARAAMADWAFPRIWLDFETIGFALPRWVGTRPYEQVPFQFSAHVEESEGAVAHVEFLSLDGTDPRRACAEALATLPAEGAVIAYNASFERGVIVRLATSFPDLAPVLESLAARLVDLLPVARTYWYHRDQRGSWSIKAVLPTIAPELDYASLAVSDGGKAQSAYMEAVTHETSAERRVALDLALREYCARDTEAMIVVARALAGDVVANA